MGIVSILVGVVVLRFVVFDWYRVPQGGMYPTIQKGGHVVTWRKPYSSISEVRRGDVIAYRVDVDGKNYDFIWRVIALPGDEVEVTGTHVAVNDVALDREKVREEEALEIFRETNADGVQYEVAYPRTGEAPEPVSVRVPEDHVFVLGDNRWNAADSRYKGSIPFSAIVGRTF